MLLKYHHIFMAHGRWLYYRVTKHIPRLPRITTSLYSRLPRTKLLRHLRMNENFDLKNHLSQQIFLPLPLINVALPPKFPWWNLSPSKQHWVRGGGLGKQFCNLGNVPIQRNWEVCTLIAFVSTSFVQYWGYSVLDSWLKWLRVSQFFKWNLYLTEGCL